MATTTPTGRFRHAKRAAWRRVSDEAVILDVETAHYFSLAGPGLRVWELLGEGRTVPEAAALLAAEYDAPAGVIGRDVGELVKRLRSEGLLEPA
jgi:hypothetical protein